MPRKHLTGWNGILKTVILKMGFFKAWIQLIYSNQPVKISMDGYLSKKISMSHGVSQGCPLSPLLFIITIETMAITAWQKRHSGYPGFGDVIS